MFLGEAHKTIPQLEQDPRTENEAVDDVDADHWVKVFENELESIYFNKVWTIVKAPTSIKLWVVNGFTREGDGWMGMLKPSQQDL
jgi:hypothetical protein